jgi:hypothetical protein
MYRWTAGEDAKWPLDFAQAPAGHAIVLSKGREHLCCMRLCMTQAAQAHCNEP